MGSTSEQPVPSSVPVIQINPEQAAEWLNTRFEYERSLRKSYVETLVRDMRTGNWIFNADPIRFNQNGKLMDGQHRLSAIVKSGTTQWFAVVNLPDEARATIDVGNARTLGDLLQIGGHVQGRIMAAIVRRLLVFYSGKSAESGKYTPSMGEGVDFVSKNVHGLREAIHVANLVLTHRFPVSPSNIGAAYFLCAEVDREWAEDFFARLTTGYNLRPGDPAAAFRDKAMRVKSETRRNMMPDDVFRFVILAWNLDRAGESRTRLQAPRGGWTEYNRPIPK